MSIKYTLTTDHPASSYGHPVFVTDKGTFGADDVVAWDFLGVEKTAADIVSMDLYDAAGPRVDVDLAKLFLSNSPQHNRSAVMADAERLEADGGVFGPMTAKAIRTVWG